MRTGAVATLGCLLSACSADPASNAPQSLRDPAFGPVPTPPVWHDDRPEKDLAELGRILFFDPRLSASGYTNCDICHVAAARFQDNLITAVPDRSYPNAFPRAARNTTSLLNIMYAPIVRWDGSMTDHVAAMVMPFSEVNMNLGETVTDAEDALYVKITATIPEDVALFEQAFGVDPRTRSPADVARMTGRALEAFSRRMVSRDSAFDQWNAGDDDAMSVAAIRGFELFRGRAHCNTCHYGPLFTDFAFHNVSTSLPGPDGARNDEGRFGVTSKDVDRGAFLTPTLRGVIDTSPYFHDGSQGFLREVIKHFTSEAVLADANHDPLLEPPAEFSDGDVEDVLEFLRALRGAPLGEDVMAPASQTP